MNTQTVLDWFTVLLVLALLAAPALAGHRQERRIDRQLARAARRPAGSARVHLLAGRRAPDRSAHSRAA
ncbi:hypothetical protein [Streptomyces indicus]|nr:hypothetical protein [Streptomyces indicus]